MLFALRVQVGLCWFDVIVLQLHLTDVCRSSRTWFFFALLKIIETTYQELIRSTYKGMILFVFFLVCILWKRGQIDCLQRDRRLWFRGGNICEDMSVMVSMQMCSATLFLNLLIVKMGCEGDCGADPLPQDSFLLLNLRLCMEPLTAARERIKGSKDVRGARFKFPFTFWLIYWKVNYSWNKWVDFFFQITFWFN